MMRKDDAVALICVSMVTAGLAAPTETDIYLH